MTAKAPRDGEEKERSYSALSVLNLIIALGSLIGMVGQWYTYREKADAGEKRMSMLEQRVQNHLDDKTIHVTEEQIKTVIKAELSPVNSTLADLKSRSDAQRESLNRIERFMERLSDKSPPNR